MATDEKSAGPEGRIKTKLRLLKIGLYGFIGSLLLTVFSLFSMGAASILGMLWTDGWIIESVANSAGSVIAVFFAAPFAFFAVLIVSLMMKPREADMTAQMKSSLGGIMILFVAGIMLCALPLLAAFAIVMATLYYRGGGIIFFSMAYFAMTGILFFLSAGYVMIRETAANKEIETDVAWVKRVFRLLHVGGAESGPVMDADSRRALTRIERVLGYLMGAALFLLFSMRDIYEAVRRITGHGSDSSLLDELTVSGTILAAMSCFIFVFSSLFIVRSVKMIFREQKQ